MSDTGQKRIVRVRSGAFVASPRDVTMRDPYREAELMDERGNRGQHWVRLLPGGSPQWVFDAYIHPDDLRRR